jgi:hypothetical protein
MGEYTLFEVFDSAGAVETEWAVVGKFLIWRFVISGCVNHKLSGSRNWQLAFVLAIYAIICAHYNLSGCHCSLSLS